MNVVTCNFGLPCPLNLGTLLEHFSIMLFGRILSIPDSSVWFPVVLLGFKWFCSIFNWFLGLGLTTLSVFGRFCLSEDSVSFWTISAYRWGCHFVWDSVWCNRPGGSCLILDGNVRFQTFPSKQVPSDFDQSNVRIFYPSYLATH